MGFVDLLKKANNLDVDNNTTKQYNNVNENSPSSSKRHDKRPKTDKPEDILRKAGLKIKLVIPTAFGVQIDFAKEYDKELIKNLLKDYEMKIKGRSIFIIY